jgi:hypothetical protein
MEQRSPAGTTALSVRRRKALTERRPSAPVLAKKTKPTPSPFEPLLKGQIWKAKETYVQIVDAGKTLIHYTMSPKPRQRGLRVHMATRETVQDFLKSNQAKLLVE